MKCQALSSYCQARQYSTVSSTKFQKAIALSSTETEFVSASDTGKYAL